MSHRPDNILQDLIGLITSVTVAFLLATPFLPVSVYADATTDVYPAREVLSHDQLMLLVAIITLLIISASTAIMIKLVRKIRKQGEDNRRLTEIFEQRVRDGQANGAPAISRDDGDGEPR